MPIFAILLITVLLFLSQLKAMRSLDSADKDCCNEQTKIVNNYRPPLPCGERRVKLGYI
jgi:hypothetical protein